MLTFNGHRWTAFDVLIAIGLTIGLGYGAVNTIMIAGVSLTSVAGSMWGFGTLLFMLLYHLPIFGRSIKSEELEKANRPLTREELREVVGLRQFSRMSPGTIKMFAIFFVLSGVLALIGIVADT